MSEQTASGEWRTCHHMIGQRAIGGFPGHEHVHPTGPQVCLQCGKTFDELLAAAYAAGQQAREGQWQDIATAPKDVFILARLRAHNSGEPPVVVGRLRAPGVVSTRPGWWDKPATHWMPLPEPPKEAK